MGPATNLTSDLASAIIAVARGQNPDFSAYSALEQVDIERLSRAAAANGSRAEVLMEAYGADVFGMVMQNQTRQAAMPAPGKSTSGGLLEGDFAAMFRRCDGAKTQDGAGFSKDDAKEAEPYRPFINAGDRIPDPMRLTGLRLLFKYYKRQLSEDGRDRDRTLSEEGLTIEDVLGEERSSGSGYAPPGEGPWDPPLPLFDVNHGPGFPLDILPLWLLEYVQAVAEETQTAPDLGAMISLAVLATASAKKFVVEIKRSWREHVCLYVNVVLGVGEGKSPVVSAMVAPVLTYERDRRREMAPTIREAQEIKRMLEQRKAAAAKAASKPDAGDDEGLALKSIMREAAEHTVPVLPQILFDDVTMARLGQAMAEHNGLAAILSAEGTIFLNATEKFGEKGGTGNFDLLLKAYSGEQWKSGRIMRGDDLIECPIATIGITTQPGVLRNLAKNPELQYKGLLARFDWSIPPSMCGSRDTDPPSRPEHLEREYGRRIRSLLDLPLSEDEEEPKPRVLRLSEDAQATLRAFRAELEPKLGEHGSLGHIADWGNKLPGKVARYAALLHLADHASGTTPNEIPGCAMERACIIGRYLTEHAQVAFAMMGADPAVEQARYVLATLVRRGSPSTERQSLWQAIKGRKGIHKAADLTKILRLLNEHRYLAEQSVNTAGRPKTYVVLNPLVVPGMTNAPKSLAPGAAVDLLGAIGLLGSHPEFEAEATEAPEFALPVDREVVSM